MGSGGGGQSAPQQSTQTSKTELPDFVQGPAKRYLGRAEELSQSPYQTYGGQRVAPLNTFHNYALDQGRAQMGTQLPAAVNTMHNFAQGGYNQPAYIHPWLGPQAPGLGLVPAGYHGYSPLPGMGGGGKGGHMPGGGTPTPQPQPIIDVPEPTPVPIDTTPPGPPGPEPTDPNAGGEISPQVNPNLWAGTGIQWASPGQVAPGTGPRNYAEWLSGAMFSQNQGQPYIDQYGNQVQPPNGGNMESLYPTNIP